jgi:hypothetical protein
MQEFPSRCHFQHLVYQRNLSLANSPRPSPVQQQPDDDPNDADDITYYQTFMGLNYGAITGLFLNAMCYYFKLPPLLNTLCMPLNLQFLMITALCSLLGALIGYYLDSHSNLQCSTVGNCC